MLDQVTTGSVPRTDERVTKVKLVARPGDRDVEQPALLFFALPPLSRSGLWDPYELNVADLSRRIALHLFQATQLALDNADNSLPHLNDLGRRPGGRAAFFRLVAQARRSTSADSGKDDVCAGK